MKTEVKIIPKDEEETIVEIYAECREDAQRVIFDLADEYTFVTFTHPVQTADGKWAAFGHVKGKFNEA